MSQLIKIVIQELNRDYATVYCPEKETHYHITYDSFKAWPNHSGVEVYAGQVMYYHGSSEIQRAVASCYVEILLGPKDMKLESIKIKDMMLYSSKCHPLDHRATSEEFFNLRTFPADSCPTIDPIIKSLNDAKDILEGFIKTIQEDLPSTYAKECDYGCNCGHALESNGHLKDDLDGLVSGYIKDIEREIEGFENIRTYNSSLRDEAKKLKALLWDLIEDHFREDKDDKSNEEQINKAFDESVKWIESKLYQIDSVGIGQKKFDTFHSLSHSGIRITGSWSNCKCENYGRMELLADEYKKIDWQLADELNLLAKAKNYEDCMTISNEFKQYAEDAVSARTDIRNDYHELPLSKEEIVQKFIDNYKDVLIEEVA